MSGTEDSVNVVVDISHHQPSVDFNLVKKDGIVAVIHKATQGFSYTDPTYADRTKTAIKAGLLWGAYHFGDGTDGTAQADHFLKTLKNPFGMLLALDVEENPNGATITPEQAEAFVNRVEQVTSRLPVIYGSVNFLKNFATPTLTKCQLWVARYGPAAVVPQGWSDWVLWQYTDGNDGPQPHEVQGIGACDRDRFNGSLQQFIYFWNGVK